MSVNDPLVSMYEKTREFTILFKNYITLRIENGETKLIKNNS